MLAPLAQVQLQDRSTGESSCIADNGFCPSWIADNLDRYVDPFVQHVFLTLVAGGLAVLLAALLDGLILLAQWAVTPWTRARTA